MSLLLLQSDQLKVVGPSLLCKYENVPYLTLTVDTEKTLHTLADIFTRQTGPPDLNVSGLFWKTKASCSFTSDRS